MTPEYNPSDMLINRGQLDKVIDIEPKEEGKTIIKTSSGDFGKKYSTSFFKIKNEFFGRVSTDEFNYKSFRFPIGKIISIETFKKMGWKIKDIPNLISTELIEEFKGDFDIDKDVIFLEHIQKELIAREEKPKEKEETEKNKNLPSVMLPQQNKVLMNEFVGETAKVLRPINIFYRVADNSVVELINNKLSVVTPSRMVSLIEEVCIPCVEIYNRDSKELEQHKKSATEQICKILLSSVDLHKGLRQIEKILFAPIPILKDGKLTFPKNQYNEDLKLFLIDNSLSINLDMKLEEANKLLINLYKEFCFKNKEDFVRALMVLLKPYLRGLYKNWNNRTPVFIYFANRERAGKDFMAAIPIIVFEGVAREETPISTGQRDSGGNEELRKKFLTALMEGRLFMHFANNKGFINNSVFEQFATANVWGDRILGSNKSGSFDNNIELSLSGNTGTTLTGDLSNRSIKINLFLQMENPNERKFERPDLHEEIKRGRGLILSALYSLVKNWFDKGMPKSKVPFASFPEWAAICGGIIEAAGFDNPLLKVDDTNITLDRKTSDMKQLFEYMHERNADEWLTKKEIRNIILSDGDFNLEVFSYLNLEERSGQIKFANLLMNYEGRELSKIIMVVDKSIKTKHKQKIKFTSVDTKVEQIDLTKDFGVGG